MSLGTPQSSRQVLSHSTRSFGQGAQLPGKELGGYQQNVDLYGASAEHKAQIKRALPSSSKVSSIAVYRFLTMRGGGETSW